MARFLSGPWLEELCRVAETVRTDPAPTGDGPLPDLTLRQVVTGGPDGDVVYDLHLHAGTVRIDRSAAGPADVELRQDHDTARRLVRGETHPQVELTEGRLRIRGPAHRLVPWQPVLAALDEAAGGLRDGTTW